MGDANRFWETTSSRRRFLKNTGAALAAGLSARSAFSQADPKQASPSGRCDFSALPPDFVYLNSGTEGSMPDCVVSVLEDALGKWARDPTASYETDPVFEKRQQLNRSRAARFLGVAQSNIALTDNTTMGLSMTLMGLNFRPNDRVVITNHEHTAIKSPLRVLQARLGLRIQTQPFPPTEALNRMDCATLLDTLFPNSPTLRGSTALCVSHVYPTTGVRLPLQALREKTEELDIRYLIVDGAQALGMIDLTTEENKLQSCDFYACPGHKWLNGPPGTGLLYLQNEAIRPPEFFPTISQRMEKYSDFPAGSAPAFPMAEALQVRGCSNVPGFAAMIRAMKFQDESGGAARIEKHILGLAGEIRKIILSRAPHCMVSPFGDASLWSGLTAFFPFKWDHPEKAFTDRKTADRVVSELLKKGIQVRSIGFPDAGSVADSPVNSYAIRVSTGYMNTAVQVDEFKAGLREVLTQIQ